MAEEDAPLVHDRESYIRTSVVGRKNPSADVIRDKHNELQINCLVLRRPHPYSPRPPGPLPRCLRKELFWLQISTPALSFPISEALHLICDSAIHSCLPRVNPLLRVLLEPPASGTYISLELTYLYEIPIVFDILVRPATAVASSLWRPFQSELSRRQSG